MKTCTKCGETKQLRRFHKKIGSLDGRSAMCAKCTNERWKRKPDKTANELIQRAW